MITKVTTRNRVSLLVVLIALLVATPAYAYIDPNTQGLITQSLTPLFVLGAAVAMFFRDKAVGALRWFNRHFNRANNDLAE